MCQHFQNSPCNNAIDVPGHFKPSGSPINERTRDAMKPFLILQLRPETEASDSEFQAILDKGDLAENDVHRVRLDCQDLPKGLNLDHYAGTIVGGGPGCVSDAADKKTALEAKIETAVMSLMPEITSRDLPYLGCCYGIGILAHHLGGPVTKENFAEPVGTSTCTLTDAGRADTLLADCPETFDAFVGHKEAVQTLPPGATHLVASSACPYQMIRYRENVYATQFHPERSGEIGEQILKNFIEL